MVWTAVHWLPRVGGGAWVLVLRLILSWCFVLVFGCVPKVPVVTARTPIHQSSGRGDLDNCLWVVKFIALPLLLEQTQKVLCPTLWSVVWIAVLLQKYFHVVCCSYSVSMLIMWLWLSYSFTGKMTALGRQLFWSWVSSRYWTVIIL